MLRRRAVLLIVLLLFVLTVGSAGAQIFPTQTPAPVERVILDTVLYINPPRREGLCMGIEAGTLTVAVRRVSEAVEGRPAVFQLSGLMVDPDAQIAIPISRQETTVSKYLNGSNRYCWSVSIDAPETEGMSNAQRGAYVQTVSVRMTLATP